MEYGMDQGTHLVYHKRANYVAMPINIITHYLYKG